MQRVRHQILPEIIVGRGAFIEGFARFGYDLKDYDALFAEKLGLLMALNTSARVTWSGKFLPPLRDAVVMSRPFQERLPLWVGALSPQSVVRTASLGLPLALPMLGDSLPGYAQTAALYREAWQAAGYDPNDARISVFSHMHVAETTADYLGNTNSMAGRCCALDSTTEDVINVNGSCIIDVLILVKGVLVSSPPGSPPLRTRGNVWLSGSGGQLPRMP